ncbi:hypothetical protein [Paenimyroides ceti]
MEKLELKHLAPYFPYGLKGRVDKETYLQEENDRIGELKTIDLADHNYELAIYGDLGYFLCDIYDYKPILRPLSNLTKEIEHNGQKFVPIDFINGEFASTIPRKIEWNQSVKNQNLHFVLSEWISPEDLYGLFELLFKWHFDIFGLIEKDLAVDINTCLNR